MKKIVIVVLLGSVVEFSPFTTESFFREKIESDVVNCLFICLAYLKN